MRSKIQQFLKSFFTLNKSEQKGIWVLLLLILLIIIFNLFLPLIVNRSETDFSEFKEEISQFREQRKLLHDSLNINRKQSKGELTKEEAVKILRPFDFDPNTLDEEGWIKMGFTPKQFQQINNYRKKGGNFKVSADVKKMYCISDVEFEIIEPFINIRKNSKITHKGRVSRDQAITNTNYKKISKPIAKKAFKYSITELNSADSISLVENLNLKPWIALRVVKYGNLLGGYYDKVQLLEVYGFSEKYYQKIETFIEVDSLLIKRININDVAFKQLLKHPYFDYETTKLIFNSKPKTKDKTYADYFDFKQRTGISDSLSTKIRHYLYFGPPK